MLIQIVRIAVINIIKATTPAKEPVSCQRFSLDLEEDLQTLLEARAAPRVANVDQHESNVAVSGNAMNKIFEMEDENKSNNANTIKRIPYNNKHPICKVGSIERVRRR
ncbi:uncharacterized protein [Eurosta solidaginis]|uniref:uncharacterized protein isoform X4 n=1 Tax=Eurosta solidaginis TaxID=178769 RepID=UPI00353099F4